MDLLSSDQWKTRAKELNPLEMCGFQQEAPGDDVS